MCRIDDVEGTWLGTNRIIARKQHTCGECGREIAKGETYDRSAYVFDGCVHSNKACIHCCAARRWLVKHCGGWVTESLGEELQEHFEEYAPKDRDGVGRLAVGVRRGWQRFSGGLMSIPAVVQS